MLGRVFLGVGRKQLQLKVVGSKEPHFSYLRWSNTPSENVLQSGNEFYRYEGRSYGYESVSNLYYQGQTHMI